MENQYPPATNQERLDMFFDSCTIGLSNQPSYTKQDLRRFIREKQKNNIRHFCQELISDAKLYVESNEMNKEHIQVQTEEEYIIDFIKQIADE